MNVTIETKVRGNVKEIFEYFNQDLFEYLAPPNIQVMAFGGSRKGDKVHFKFGFPVYGEWKGEIIDYYESENEIYFIDIGVKMPLGLKKWHHKHHLIQDGDFTIIQETLNFSCKNAFLNGINYLPIALPLFQRKKLYPKYFNKVLRKPS